MRIVLTLLLLAFPPSPAIPIASGVADEDLADTPMTDAINMEASSPCNQISLTVTVTPGTTTRVDVTCYESLSATSGFGVIPLCDAAVPSTCKPDVKRFTLSNFTANGDGDYEIAVHWPVAKKWVKCSADDPDDGTGTVTITGSRSWQ